MEKPHAPRILVVDDSPAMRAVIRRILESEGYAVDEAADGVEALKRIALSKDYDLVTLDVEMPGMDGFATCAHIRGERYHEVFNARSRLNVVFVTGCDSVEQRRRGFELGAIDFVSKEFIESDMAVAVNRVLRPAALFSGMRALVVEDSQLFRKVVADALIQLGVSVVEASAGDEAFAILSRGEAPFDLVVTDLEMPGMDGLELTSRMRGALALRDTPVIILSGVSDRSVQISLFKAGATDYLVKPFIKEELMARLRVHLAECQASRRLKEAFHQLKEANRQLVEERGKLARLAAEQRELLHVMCHDLANPLGAVVATLEMDVGPEEFGNFRRDLLAGASAGLELVGLVRKIRAIDEEKLRLDLAPWPLASLVSDSLSMLRRRFAGKGVSAEVRVDPSLQVLVEPTAFVNSVMNNLLTNALKFSPSGAAVTVTGVPDGEGWVRLRVEDRGIGIPPKILENLFDVSKQTSRPGTAGETGTGFGMPLVKKFIEACGGSIEVRSRVAEGADGNGGTTVDLRLKAVPPPMAEAAVE